MAEAASVLLGYATILTKCEEDGTSDEIAYTYAQVDDLVVPNRRAGKVWARRFCGPAKTRHEQRAVKFCALAFSPKILVLYPPIMTLALRLITKCWKKSFDEIFAVNC